MKILIATDSFKDCLSAKEVGNYLEKGLHASSNKIEVRNIPMGDGGEGTVEALVEATRGRFMYCKVKDPLFRDIEARYGVLGDGQTAVIEMAAASGIELLKPEERNPWLTTTYGTGQLILDALSNDYKRIICCIGGSATTDGGIGMAAALGVKFLKADGTEVHPVGGELHLIEQIDRSGLDVRAIDADFLIACDVNNPLTGPEGAAAVYGPQKGADKEMVQKLDAGLAHYAGKIKESLGKDVHTLPGAGAAGGLGAGFVAFLHGYLKRGIEIVRQETKLDEHVHWADYVLTGEGKMDQQTKYGKTPQGVADVARKYRKPLIGIAGTLGHDYQELYHSGFTAIFSITDKPMPLEEALTRAPELLENLGMAIGNLLYPEY